MPKTTFSVIFTVLTVCVFLMSESDAQDPVVRVFIFAGQSNMVGSDSRVADIQRFPPFVGLENPQPDVRFWYCLGRENKTASDGWTKLQPVNQIVGPELSFARDVAAQTDSPIAIIKVAAGGTHLGGDWNPDEPIGFKMYPLALQKVKAALAELDAANVKYRLEGFMWHQGENDMFNEDYMANYGKNLKNFLASWRQDLNAPKLRFYIGELCTKTIWGMDLRPRMYAISLGQKTVTSADPLADYVPTSHVGVEIGGGVGLHYHYGTLGQLEHGVNYADAYLRRIGKVRRTARPLTGWPYTKNVKVKLFVLAGHRNMEGERAFVQELAGQKDHEALLNDDAKVAFRYRLGGGYRQSDDWERMGPAGFYGTFGPELSFSRTLRDAGVENVAIAKFTHSGSQIIDWTPEGSVAKSRNLYADFVTFVKESRQELIDRGHEVEVAGVFYHVGENDMSWGPFRQAAPDRLMSLITQSRIDLELPELTWFVSQQPPTDDDRVNAIDVTAKLESVLATDSHTVHLKVFDPPPQDKKLVLDTQGIVWLGEQLAQSYLSRGSGQRSTARHQAVPDRLVVLTFDDSAISHATHVGPLLKKYGFGATFFITEGFNFTTNKKDYMTWEQIRELHEMGFEIGNHTRRHSAVNKQTQAELDSDVAHIEEQCRRYDIPKPVSFCYPGYATSDQAVEVLAARGYRFARAGGARAFDPASDNPLLMPQTFDGKPDSTLEQFVKATSLARDGKIAVMTFHGIPDGPHPWVSTTPEKMESYLKHLAEQKCTVIALRDVAKYLPATDP